MLVTVDTNEEDVLANHLTPAQLATEVNMKRQEVIARCVEMNIPIFHGRIDKSLFITSMKQLGATQTKQAA